MLMDINQTRLKTHCGDHFTKHTCIKSLCCRTETNAMLHVNYSLIKKKKNRRTEKETEAQMEKNHPGSESDRDKIQDLILPSLCSTIPSQFLCLFHI